MALSEDAIAIVAAQLTTAQCALAAPYRPNMEEPGAETAQEVVKRMFEHYLAALRRGQVDPPETPVE